MGDVVFGADLSNYQPEAMTSEGLEALLSRLVPRPEHIVIRLPLLIERPNLRPIAVAQLQTVKALGYLPGGYVWCYGSADPSATVDAGISVASEAGVELPILWLDVEDTTDPCVGGWIWTAIQHGAEAGIEVGIYTGEWYWKPRYGQSDFSGVKLWLANYDGSQTIGTSPFGNFDLVAHQYTDKPFDLDVFLPCVTGKIDVETPTPSEEPASGDVNEQDDAEPSDPGADSGCGCTACICQGPQ